MRICFIGNSHLGCVKLGMDRLRAAFPTVEPTFFASPSNGLAHLHLSGRRLESRTPAIAQQLAKISGGSDHIDLDAYDKVVLVGLGLGFNLVGRVYNSHRTARMAWRDAPHLVSDACFATAIAQAIASSLALRIAAMVHAVRGEPVIILPNPLLSEKILSFRVPRRRRGRAAALPLAPARQQARVWQDLSRSGDIALVWDVYRAALAALPPSMAVQEQPDVTRARTYFTAEAYGHGALRLGTDQGQPAFDVAHMNADFGAEVLRPLLGSLGAVPALPATG